MPQNTHLVALKIEEIYRQRTPKSAEQHQKAQTAMPGGDTRTITYFGPHPLYIDYADGQHLTDMDGNQYTDFLSNYTSMIHGHNHPAIVKAIAEQAARGTAYAANNPLQIALAEEIQRRVPSVDYVRFGNSGTEATMTAIRAARAFTGRSKILKMEGGYHGSHDWVEISVAPKVDAAGPSDAPLPAFEEPGIPQTILQDVIIAPFNDVQAAEAAFEQHGGDLAAVIIEPVMGAAGVIPAEEGYLQALRDLCDQHGALLIFDEVITLRLSEGGAQAIYDVAPDLTAFGKIIGGGLPVGGIGGRAEVMSLFAPPNPKMVHSGTYNASPLVMAAGLTAMQLLTTGEIERINRLGARLATGLEGAFEEMGVNGQVTSIGSLANLHFTPDPVTNYRGAAASVSELNRLTHLGLLNRGIFVAKRDMFAVSTPMSDDDIDAAIGAFADTLGELKPYIADEAPHLLS